MDLISAKVEAAERSRKDRKPVFVSVLPDGECELVAKYPGPEKALAYFVNGSEKPVPSQSEIEASVKPAKKETKAKESPDKKVSKKMKTTSQSAIGAKNPKTAKKKDVKKSTKSADRKAVTGADAIKRLLGAGAKKVTLSVKKALEKSKDNYLYRASNGSPLGKYYLTDYKDKDAEIEFLVKAK